MDKHAVDRLAASVRAHPAWSSLTFTIVLCALVAVLLSLARGDTLEPEILVMSYSIGLSIHVCMYVGFVWWAPRLPPPVVSVAMLGCGLVLGMAVGGTLTEGRPLLLLRNGQALAIGAVLGALTVGGSCMMESWWDTRARLDRAERDALARDKALVEAELRVLQAQVEPHFLFNTLANVVSLIHTHPDRAARLLERLTSLLRASLSRARRADGTLGDELAVVRAYLDIQAERMAGRMTYRVDVDPGLESVRMPPLLLQPLVENAVLHGIEPSAAGGHVAVHAERSGGVVRIRVVDDGLGIDSDTAGHGLGIANVRERLRAAFGDRGRLGLSETPGGGVSADLRIPVASGADMEAE